MQSSQSMYNLGTPASGQYVPSHLRQHIGGGSPSSTRQQVLPLRRSSTVSRFGGASFGTPRTIRHPSRGTHGHEDHTSTSFDEAPPMASIYDAEVTSSSNAPPSLARGQANVESPVSPPYKTNYAPRSAVIVFGFPDQLLDHVLEYFGRFGSIVEYAQSAASSIAIEREVGRNWLRLTYQDTASASRAVAANGVLLGDAFMIGCVWAGDEPEIRPSQRGDDAMEIDPKTPEQRQPSTRPLKMPVGEHMQPQTLHLDSDSPTSPPKSPAAVRVSGGTRIKLLTSEDIYKQHVATSSPDPQSASNLADWLSGWMSSSKNKVEPMPATTSKSVQQTAQKQSSLLRTLVDIVFGF
ncbi:hypothetical protein PYCC9005_005574 [Savitreella phatthalungensis]